MNSIPEIIEDIRAGKMVILVDDENRENEGDLILAADFVTPQAINFMAREARGLICLALTSDQISRLGLPLMVREDTNLSPNKTAFTVTIEAATGVSTGISAADRAHTIRVASSPAAKRSDIIMPGHVFPIRAQDGGVLKRAGHTEASVDLAKLAGLNAAAVICEIMNPDGSMARMTDLKEFALKHEIKVGTIEALIEHRLRHESFVEEIGECPFPTDFGTGFRMKLFRNQLDGREHLAIVKGEVQNTDQPVPVRVHVENVLGDIFRYERGNTFQQIDEALREIDKAGLGVLVYLRQEGTAPVLKKKFDLMLEDPEVRAAAGSDDREYGLGAQILRALGLKNITLVNQFPGKRVGLKSYGIEIVNQPKTEDACSNCAEN